LEIECARFGYNASLTKDTASNWTVDALTQLAEGIQPQITIEELLEAEDIVRKDVRVPTVVASWEE
jgi:primary-amine oxidase